MTKKIPPVLVKAAFLGFLFAFLGFSGAIAHADESDEFMLEEVTVTAQKRAENQQKVPIAMSIVSGEDIDVMGQTNFEEILSNISGVFINTSQDGMRVAIRGMSDDTGIRGNVRVMNQSSPMVAVHADGVYSSIRAGAGLFDIERVEVLFGPQSTLYSTTSPGGVVNILTASPKLDTTEMSASFKFGNYKHLQSEGMLNAPLSDSSALRLAYLYSNRDGFLTSGANDEDTQSGRLRLLLEPNDKFSFTATGEVTKTAGMTNGVYYFVNQDDLDNPWDDSNLAEVSSRNLPRERESWVPKLYGQADVNLDSFSLAFIPMWGSHQYTHSYAEERDGYSTEENGEVGMKERGAELRMVSSPGSFLTWVLGANYYKSKQYEETVRVYTTLTDSPDIIMKSEYEQETKAVYGNITYPVADDIRLTGGLRWTDDTSSTLQDTMEVRGISSDGTMNIGYQYVINKSSFDGFDYKLGVEYDIGHTSMLYADVSTSYRLVPVPMSGDPLEPEEMIAYQIGSKNRFFNNRLQVNAAVYYYDYTNYVAELRGIQAPETSQDDPGATTNADLRKIGADVETSLILGADDRLDVSVSYLDSEFTDLYFDFESELLPDLDATGDSETFSSKWTINATYTKGFNLSNGALLTAKVDARYQTGYYIDFKHWAQNRDSLDSSEWYIYDLGTGTNYQEAFHTTNFSLVYKSPDGKWNLTGYVNNIEDYAYKRNLHDTIIYISDPRTYGAVFSMKF